MQETSPNLAPRHIDDSAHSSATCAALIDIAIYTQPTADNMVVPWVAPTFADQKAQDDEISNISLIDSRQALVFRDGVGIPTRS